MQARVPYILRDGQAASLPGQMILGSRCAFNSFWYACGLGWWYVCMTVVACIVHHLLLVENLVFEDIIPACAGKQRYCLLVPTIAGMTV